MTPVRKFERPIVVRLALSLLLGVTAAGLFFLNRISLTTPERREVTAGPATAGQNGAERPELPLLYGEIDREVDSVLVRLGIEESWMHRREIQVPNARFPRIERRVLVPKDLATVIINAAFNEMAKRYNGRAIASENLRENHVTIHIEVAGTIVQTIILRPTENLKRDSRPRTEKRV
jgi:hypothetical protein